MLQIKISYLIVGLIALISAQDKDPLSKSCSQYASKKDVSMMHGFSLVKVRTWAVSLEGRL